MTTFLHLRRLKERFESSDARSLSIKVRLLSVFWQCLMLWWQRQSVHFNFSTRLKAKWALCWRNRVQLPSRHSAVCKEKKKLDRYGKVGVTPYESAVCLKVLFLKFIVQLHEKCLFFFETGTNLSIDLIRTEVSVKRNGLEEKKDNIQNRVCTFVARMPSNWEMYITVTSHIFTQYICGCFGSVHDCYNVQSRLIDEPFESLRTANNQEVVNDSDEKEYWEGLNASIRSEKRFWWGIRF